MLRHRVAVLFGVVRPVGFACAWLWHHSLSEASSFLWNAGIVLLFPGNMLGSGIIEKCFGIADWRSW